MSKLCGNINIERLENGLIINKENSPDILYLSETETEVFDLLVEKSPEETAKEISKSYVGETIKEDIMEFYNNLVEKGIFEK